MAIRILNVLRSPLLFPRLSRWLLILLTCIAALQFTAVLLLQRRFIDHAFQVSNADLALSLAGQLKPFITERSIDMATVGTLLREFQTLGPTHGYYLLSGDGEILITSSERLRLQHAVVPTGPLMRYLAKSGERDLPILAQDPLAEERMVPFSVAALRTGVAPLYLYITLQSSSGELLYRSLIRREAPFIAAITLLAAVAFAGVAALVFSMVFVRRLDRMRKTLEEFGRGDERVRDSDRGNDELAFLSRSFNAMADTISSQMRQIRDQEFSRRELVQNICHDLRTPLTAARGYLETLELRKDRTSPEERERILGVVDQNLRFMQSMAEELFDLASLESGDRPLDLKSTDLATLADEVVEKVREIAPMQVRVERGRGPFVVVADRALVLRAMTNLVQNAIRYTPNDGEVTVSIDRVEGAVRLTVADTGIGIDSIDHERIFTRFYRTDRARMMTPKGSGLGLAIVQRIAELHGTSVELESEVGKGSRFTLALPLR